MGTRSMHGLPVEITSYGDLLVYGGLFLLGLLGLLAILVPRWMRRAG